MNRWIRPWMIGVAVAARLASAAPADEAAETPPPPGTQEYPLPGGPARMAPALRAQLERDFLARHAAGDYAGGIALIEEWRKAEPAVPDHPYNLACLKSLDGRPAEALADLRTSIELGWTDFRHLERDPDLVAARARPEFAEIAALNEPAQRRRAAALRDALRRRFGEGYRYEQDDDLRLVFAAGVDRGAMDLVRAHLGALARAQRKTLFRRGLEQHVVVIVPDDQTRMPGPLGGFYASAQRVLVSRTVGREMNHEFTHAMHIADMEARGQKHPPWILEGFAVLFEAAHIDGDRYLPEHSLRLNAIQAALRRNRALPFERLAALNLPDFMKNAEVAYPQSGYLFHYLHAQGLLERWYEAYTEGFAEDATGLRALGAVLGRTLPEIEKDWRAWVLSQRPPPVRAGRNAPMLGVATEAHRSGLRVVSVVPGSPAAAAGFAAGDVIETFAGRRVTDPLQLVKLVSERAAGDRVEIEFRRGEERFIVRPALAGRAAAPR